MKLKFALSTACMILPLSPALAEDAAGPVFTQSASFTKHIPSQLKSDQSEYYRSLFRAMQSNQWDAAKNLLDNAPKGPLKSIAQAEFFLAANSPRAQLVPLLALVNDAPHIPQAAQLGRLAKKRGATALPRLPQRQKLSFVPGATKRTTPRPVNTDSATNGIRASIRSFIKNDAPRSAEAFLNETVHSLTAEGRTEMEQRVAWSYYIENDDASALRVAQRAQDGSGPWVVHANWVVGLASWRMKDCQTAATAFDKVSKRADDRDLRAAGYYWAARADMMCGRAHQVQGKLQNAARQSDSFYGLLAAKSLGMEPAQTESAKAFAKADWRTLERHDNVRSAIALVEIGEETLADEVLRHQAGIGDPGDHVALLKLARELSLPRTQLWLAHHAPRGFKPDTQAQFPAPNWTPDGGWRVDPALVYAHTLQESAFRTKAVSSANAIGLMQVRPGTAGDIARTQGKRFEVSQLYRPSTNLEYGQSYLEYLEKSPITKGKLPKIVAAYNAGPGAVQRWNSEVRDNDDPLLYMESIPYYETRGYVSIILRNYWMYEKQAGINSVSAGQLAQNQWPRFPSKPSRNKLKLAAR